MQVFQYHVFVCDQVKAEGLPSCNARGGTAVLEELRMQVGRQGLTDTVQVTMCGSLGLCERGPNMVVYPEGTWYSGVQRADVAEIVESHFKKGQVVERLLNSDPAAVRAEIGQNRGRFLASLRQKDESGALPDPLMQTARAFQESRVVLTAIELDVFSALGQGSTAAQAASKIGADPRATEMLLNALAAMKLADKHGDVFSNTPMTARYLTAAGASDSRAALMHTVHLWKTWSRLTDAVRGGTAPASGGGDRDDRWTEAFIAAMHKNASERAGAVVRAVAAPDARRMLDVGGGSGAYSIAFAQANPQLSVEILDLPEVTSIAQRHITAAKLEDRVRTRGGDLRTDALGRDEYDIVLLSAICHMLGAEENHDLLSRCFAAAAPGGRLVIQDFILDASKTAPKSGALFALNMLVGTAGGSSYSEPEYAEWLRAAGFADLRHVALPGPTGLMIGVKARE